MAKSAKTRRSGTTRKVAAIEHQLTKTEPVEMEAGKKAGHISEKEADLAEKADKAAKAKKAAALKGRVPVAQKEEARHNKFGYVVSLFAGVTGGIIAVAGITALQKARILPAFATGSQQVEILSDAGFENEIAELRNQLAGLSSAQDNIVPVRREPQAAADAQQNAANAAATIIADVEKKAQSALDAVGQIRKELAENPNEAAITALQETVMQRIRGLEDKLKELDELKQDISVTQSATQNHENKLEILKKDMESLAEQKRKDGAGMTLLVAANALKAAVDRGSSYVNELRTFKAVAPQDFSLDLLEKYAGKGLPSASELSRHFARIADRIAQTESTIPVDAGLGEKLWAYARELVATRPVGDVEGDTPGAIAARMEVAISEGDYVRALNEWQTLPDHAKVVSADFMTILQARYDVDNLLSRFVSTALSYPVRVISE